MIATSYSDDPGTERHSTAPAAGTSLAAGLDGLDFAESPVDDVVSDTSTPADQLHSSRACHGTVGAGGSGLPVAFHQPDLVIADIVTVLRRRGPVSVGLQFPAAGGRVERRLEDITELSGELRILDPGHDFDTPIEVAMHHIGAANPVFVDRVEVDDARVLEESAEDRAHADVFRITVHARPQRADSADHHLDSDPGLRRAVERVDHLLVDKSIGLQPD